MPKSRRSSPLETSRLTILAAGDDEEAFAEYACALLASGARLQREAALDALVGRPVATVRGAVRDLFSELQTNGIKHDQGGTMRVAALRIVTAIGDSRDSDLAIVAADAREVAFGEDIAWRLRAQALLSLDALAPDLLPFIAAEHLDDASGPEQNEPAATAMKLLLERGEQAMVYAWLLSHPEGTPLLAAAFEMFVDVAPPEIVLRFVARATQAVARRDDEPFAIALAEAIVRLELEPAYESIEAMMSARISEELYHFLAVLLARTNRAPLLAILERQLWHGRQREAVIEALQLRTTDEQRAILKRWEERD